MLGSAIGRVAPGVVGIDALCLPCPRCERRTVRIFAMGDDAWGCRACARPSPEIQLARFYEEVSRVR